MLIHESQQLPRYLVYLIESMISVHMFSRGHTYMSGASYQRLCIQSAIQQALGSSKACLADVSACSRSDLRGLYKFANISRNLRPRHGLGHPMCQYMSDVAQIPSQTLPSSQSGIQHNAWISFISIYLLDPLMEISQA